MKEKVWFDFGNGPRLHEEKTTKEMDAFIEGVQFACEELNIEDYQQYDTETELPE